MQFIPDQQSARSTAILISIIFLILVYLLVFHWFILRHLEYSDELSDLRDTLTRFESVASLRDTAESQLAEIQSGRDDASLFLVEADFNEAAAAMSDRLGQMVRTLADPDCQIVSRQPVRPRVEERYERVTVNVRMRCGLSDLLQILHQMEIGTPLMLIDDMNIIKPRTQRRVGGVLQEPDNLDIRFNMLGYLNQ